MTRIQPVGPATAYQTYQVASPPDVLIPAACQQVGCAAWLYGWETTVDESTPLGQQQAAYIRVESKRTFREQRTAAGLTVFRFEAKQRCFTEHYTRPEVYLVRGGDWRQNLGLIRRHTRPGDWVEDFGEHQQHIADRQQEG
jgi:hypothetical protein